MLQNYVTADGAFLVGDLNSHVDDRSDYWANRFINILTYLNYHQLIHAPTHKSGHTLVIAVTRETDDIVEYVTVKGLISDHCLIECKLNIGKPPSVKRTITARKTAINGYECIYSGYHCIAH